MPAKTEFPEQFPFNTIIPVRITDINYGNHVGNDSFLSIIHEARVQFLASLNLAELSFAGVGLIMRDLHVDFKAELFYGDKVLVEVVAKDFTKISFNIYYKLLNEKTKSIVAEARTGMVCFDYGLKKVVAIPEEAKAKF